MKHLDVTIVGVGEAFGCDYCRSGGGGSIWMGLLQEWGWGKHLDVTIAGVGVGVAFGCDYCGGGGSIWM